MDKMTELRGKPVYFEHSSEIWTDFPELVPGVLYATGITRDVAVDQPVDAYEEVALSRLATASEGEFPEIQAWRRAFAKMGLKPTQYRCASESLLRRFKKEKSLPKIHPLIDVCNATSMAFAVVSIAVFDAFKVSDHIAVRHATGDETYLAFSGATENPEPREVVFADGAGNAHARRWTNRQSGLSAVSDGTSAVLIIAEAMHASAEDDIPKLTAALAEVLDSVWSATVKPAMLSRLSPRFTF